MTVVLRDVGSNAPELGFVAALAVAEAVEEVLVNAPTQRSRALLSTTGHQARLKWPNDVLVGGAKLAGLLLEIEDTPSGLTLLLGIGVNLRHAPEDAGCAATSLHVVGGEVAPEAMLALVLNRLGWWLDTWRSQGFGVVRTSWLARGHRPGDLLRLNGPDSQVDAAFVDLDTDGALLAQVGGVIRRYCAVEILAV